MTEAASIAGAVKPIEVRETGGEHSRIEHGGLETDQAERPVALGNMTARPRAAPCRCGAREINPREGGRKIFQSVTVNELASDGSGSGRVAATPRCEDCSASKKRAERTRWRE